jgi:hypothetical protein
LPVADRFPLFDSRDRDTRRDLARKGVGLFRSENAYFERASDAKHRSGIERH